MSKLRIFLGDDHQLVRQGLRKILEDRSEWQVVGEASDGRESVKQILALQPDVAIMDIGMLLLNGIEATRQIVRRAPRVRVLILSMHLNEAYVTRALQAGATGYLLKDSADTDLILGDMNRCPIASERSSSSLPKATATRRWPISCF